jgi:predicted N-acetyltransferase YhbS
MRLRDVDPVFYEREVLPRTAALWAGKRDFDTYAAHLREIAGSGYGRRSYRTAGLFDGATVVASFKRYRRVAHAGAQRLKAIGIGAVFTPQEYRGRGYATAMLAAELDRARGEGADLVYLFSDIAPRFYAEIGFRELPSREISLRSDGLPAVRLAPARLAQRDWNGVRRCFEAGETQRPAGFLRSPLVWDWLRLRMRQGSERAGGQETNLVIRRGRNVVAYVLGERHAERDAYLFDEFGFAGDEGAQMIPALLRAGAGDLRRVIGWLPPSGARELLASGVVRKRNKAVYMAAPLSPAGATFVRALLLPDGADACWHTEHI